MDTFDGTFVGKVLCCKFGASASLNLDLLPMGSSDLPFPASTLCQIKPSLDLYYIFDWILDGGTTSHLRSLLIFDVSHSSS